MDSISYLFFICFILLFILTIYSSFRIVYRDKEITDDLVNFIFERAEELFDILSEDYRNHQYDILAEAFTGWMINNIKASNLPNNLKELATMDNVSLLSKPILEFLYNKKFGKTRLIELRKVAYSEEEELLLIQEEMRFLFDRIVLRKNKE